MDVRTNSPRISVRTGSPRTTITTTRDMACDPWREPLKCPLLIFTILVVLGALWTIWTLARSPNVNNQGQPISTAQKWTVGIIGLVIYLIIAYLFGLWMYHLCLKCEVLNSWLVFLLAIFFPIILALVLTIIIGIILGITSFVTRI